jgi:hypothetical protein
VFTISVLASHTFICIRKFLQEKIDINKALDKGNQEKEACREPQRHPRAQKKFKWAMSIGAMIFGRIAAFYPAIKILPRRYVCR